MSAREQTDFRGADDEIVSVNLLRFEQVSKKTALGRTVIYELIKLGKFPSPVKVNTTSVRWIDRDIVRWIEQLAEVRDSAPVRR